MIQGLIESLQALAAPAPVQLARFPDFVVKADELALDFDDAFLLVRDCPQLELTGRQRDALAEVDATLSGMSGQQRSELWTEDAVRTSPRWDAVRQHARAALVALDAAVADPGPSRAVYVRGKRPGT
jgi:hypothetical protein